MSARYKLIGVDLDGTLLTSGGEVGDECLDAVARAQAAGVLVVPCTGRAWRESHNVLAGLPRANGTPGVFVTGAAISDLDSGATLDIAVIEPHLAAAVVDAMRHLPEAVLVFRDANTVGHDYLVTGDGALTPNTQWWFEATGATVHFAQRVGPEDLHHTLRVGAVAAAPRVGQLKAQLAARFGGRVLVQSFEAVQMPDPAESVHVLEVFGAGVDKWRGLTWIARQRGVERHEIAVIGDSVNDVAAVREAGLGIAMGNAIDEVKAAAHRITRDNDHAGVAHAIEQILAGRW